MPGLMHSHLNLMHDSHPPPSSMHASSSSSNNVPMQLNSCKLCGNNDHVNSDCYLLINNPCSPTPSIDQVNAINNVQGPRFDPYSNTYNDGWKNNPMFGQSNFRGQTQNNYVPNQGKFQGTIGFNKVSTPLIRIHQALTEDIDLTLHLSHKSTSLTPSSPPPKSSLELTMEAFINAQSKKNVELEEGYKQLQSHNEMMESQKAQLVSALKDKSNTLLPSQGIDPREHANVVVTRSGKCLGDVHVKEGGNMINY
ncbi:NAD-dependent protein deacylase [Bienertia sinuspersici]